MAQRDTTASDSRDVSPLEREEEQLRALYWALPDAFEFPGRSEHR